MAKNFLYKLVKKYNVSKPLFVTYFIASFLILYFLFFSIVGQKGLVQFFILKNQIKEKLEENLYYKELNSEFNKLNNKLNNKFKNFDLEKINFFESGNLF